MSEDQHTPEDQLTSIRKIRAFNRYYTDLIGLLDKHLLNSAWSLAEARILYEIAAAGSLQASQIMQVMHIDRGYLSRLLKQLEKNKLIARHPSEQDARAFMITLTAKGTREFQQLNKASDDQVGQLINPLSEPLRQELVAHMKAIMDILKTTDMATGIHPEDITCRNELRPGDLGYVAYLHGRIYAKECGYGLSFEAYVLQGLQEFAHQYDPEKDKVWICEHDNHIVGFLLGFHRPDNLQLRYFILLPDYRGIGLGKKLMIEFLAFMKQRQYTRAYLWTTNEQHAATSLYTRHGFRLTEEKISNAFDKQLIERKYELAIGTN